jgi:hypothetical protein
MLAPAARFSTPATTYSAAAPGAPNSQVRPGAKIPPKDSPNTHTIRPHAAPASPPSRDGAPRAAASIQMPMPTWIQTAAAPACRGWNDHDVPAQFTTCCTHAGELAAVGSITRDGRPIAMPGWACRIPSTSQSTPNPIRSTRRPAGSADAGAAAAGSADTPSQTLALTQVSPRLAKMSSAMIPWCSNSVLNASTTAGAFRFSPEFIPGMTPSPRLAGPTPPGLPVFPALPVLWRLPG